MISTDIFDIDRPDNHAVDINKEESIGQVQDRHNRDAIIALYISEQAAHMHSDTVTEEAMQLFDNLMKHELNLADVESDENVKTIAQLLDAKLEDMSKRTVSQNCELKHNNMLGF